MKDELMTFQKRAVEHLRKNCANAQNFYKQTHQNQVISFTAPTGAGKTIIMSALIEEIYFGNETYVEQPEAIFVWLSDSPELNLQSKEKIDNRADKVRLDQCVVIEDDSFDRETLEEGHIYFLNTQKLSTSSNLTKHSDNRQYTIYETLSNTIAEKADHLYFIIDEAHRGMRGKEAGRATTIMQKFILGSEKDDLKPVPVVIGMSATIQRFNMLVQNSSATIQQVRASTEEVRASGLLKDRVIIYYPKDASEQKDMAILQAATEEWVSKCKHWETFCREQHHWMVRPIFVVQVLNGANDNITETDLDECLRNIEQKAGIQFSTGEVVHAFGDTKGAISVNGLDVPYEEPSKIQDNRLARVVFFKETLSTGWDCPRAETMMSFRRYTDATAIAQLLGRMVRTPIQQRILVDDMLNDVQLFLPHFDADKVQQVVDELQNSEGGDLPTDVYGDEIEHGAYTVLTTRPVIKRTPKTPVDDYPSLFDEANSGTTTVPASSLQPDIPQTQAKPAPIFTPQTNTGIEEPDDNPIEFEYELDRSGIVQFINSLALRSYQVRNFQMSDYLKSLFEFSNFLLISGLDVMARDKVVDNIVERIHDYIQQLKNTGKYAAAKEQVMNFEMLANVYDAFGEPIKSAVTGNLFSESSVDLDRQVRIADKQLRDEEVSKAYASKYGDVDNHVIEKVDVILFVCDEKQMTELVQWAEKEFNRLNDAYRQKTTKLSETLKTQYRNIVRNSAEVSNIPFNLGENIFFHNDEGGKEFDDHLFVDEITGIVRIKLNGWEERVIDEERKRDDFRCWYRNPSKGKDALTLYHDYKGTPKPFYPDFLIIRRENGGDYILDILEPHDPTRDDNVSKAKALAKYAADHPAIGRAQLIRLYKTATGEVLKRLDFAAHSELRTKVMSINLPDELDNLFTQYGE